MEIAWKRKTNKFLEYYCLELFGILLPRLQLMEFFLCFSWKIYLKTQDASSFCFFISAKQYKGEKKFFFFLIIHTSECCSRWHKIKCMQIFVTFCFKLDNNETIHPKYLFIIFPDNLSWAWSVCWVTINMLNLWPWLIQWPSHYTSRAIHMDLKTVDQVVICPLGQQQDYSQQLAITHHMIQRWQLMGKFITIY